ncbi:MAG: phosphoglycerate kinase [Spirochaetia bacterium]|nr:phosphoglycerate kinase [Spirochaetia bacterium]
MLNDLPNIKHAEVNGKKVLLRVDFNVPFDKNTGIITDETRIKKSIPTIEYLLNNGASVILISHMGRPNGKKDEQFSLVKVIDIIKKYIKQDIIFCEETTGEKAKSMAENLKSSEVLLLENIRFKAEETSKNKEERESLAKELSELGDIYVDDAFGCCHREHASIVELAELLPSYAGFLLHREIEMLDKVLTKPERPFVVVIGGSKVSTKIKLLETFVTKVDTILVGGAMAYTILKARLLEIGSSLIEREFLSNAFQLVDKASYHKCQFVLPEDHIIADEFSENAKIKKTGKEIPAGWMGMDIGPKTADKYEKIIKEAKTVLWNGPMGVFEMSKFDKGTMAVAKAVAKCKGITIAGGGDSYYAAKKAGIEDKITHLSTGGGAMLEYIEGKKLPGIQVLLSGKENE